MCKNLFSGSFKFWNPCHLYSLNHHCRNLRLPSQSCDRMTLSLHHCSKLWCIYRQVNTYFWNTIQWCVAVTAWSLVLRIRYFLVSELAFLRQKKRLCYGFQWRSDIPMGKVTYEVTLVDTKEMSVCRKVVC